MKSEIIIIDVHLVILVENSNLCSIEALPDTILGFIEDVPAVQVFTI